MPQRLFRLRSPVPPALLLALLLSACGASGDRQSPAAGTSANAAAVLGDDRQRASYMVGLDQARQLQPIMAELDFDTVMLAMRTVQKGESPLLDEKEIATARAQFALHLRQQQETRQRQLGEQNRAQGEIFLAGNSSRSGVVTTASGLQYEVIRAGTGARPKPVDTVRVNYVGMNLDGDTFESTYDTDHPAEFVLNSVMPGWTEGVVLMPVGSKYRFWMPSALAYGERGVAEQVEPNAVVVFEIELLDIAAQ